MPESSKSKFTFINLSHPDDLKDRNTIDQIRSSAMTNFGRMRRERKVEAGKDQVVFEVAVPDAVGLSRVGLDTLDPFASCSFPMDPQSSSLCSNMFSRNEGHSETVRSAWAAVLLFDELSFETLLASASLYETMLQMGQLLTEDTSDSLCHHSNALRVINEKLDAPENHTSDSVIGSMTGVLMHDYIIDDHDSWNSHMHGLIKMVSMRGGPESLNSEQLHVMLSWTDICGCFSQDLAPHFTLPPLWDQVMQLPPSFASGSAESAHSISTSSYLSSVWRQELPESHSWLSIYDKLTCLLTDRNRETNTWMEPAIWSLLSLRPMQNAEHALRASVIEEVCRIGSLLFLAPIWRSFGVHPVRTVALRMNLLNIFNSYFVEWNELRLLLLWTLAHAVREAEDTNEQKALALRLVMVMSKMEIGSWDAARGHVSQVLPTAGTTLEPESVWHSVGEAVNELARPAESRYVGFGSSSQGNEIQDRLFEELALDPALNEWSDPVQLLED